jgi:membrane-associated phospholipid phosphatase
LNSKKLAFLISALLHPLLLPSLAFFILLYVHPIPLLAIADEGKWRLLTVIFILTFAAPIFGILIFYFTGSIEDLQMKNPQDRHLPFIMTSIFYMISTALFVYDARFQAFPILGVIIGSITISLVIVTIVTFFWKISAHSTGISGVVGFLMGLSYKLNDEALIYPIVACIIIAGILMSARLYLNAHSPNQILAGSALGFAVSLTSIALFL